MNSRIDNFLCLMDGGKTVRAKGPIIIWEPDEVSAVVHRITIKQRRAGPQLAWRRDPQACS